MLAVAPFVRPAFAAFDGDTQTALNTIIWKTAPGSQWDILFVGDSRVAAFPYDELEVRPHQKRSLLTCGLPGNSVAGVQYALESLNLFHKTKPRAVFIMVGFNDAIVQNREAWLTPRQWADAYSKIVSAAMAVGANVVCLTSFLPERVTGIDESVSVAQLQAYNQIVRGAVCERFSANPAKFAVLDAAGLLSGQSDYSPPGSMMDGVHPLPWVNAKMRQWMVDALAPLEPI